MILCIVTVPCTTECVIAIDILHACTVNVYKHQQGFFYSRNTACRKMPQKHVSHFSMFHPRWSNRNNRISGEKEKLPP